MTITGVNDKVDDAFPFPIGGGEPHSESFETWFSFAMFCELDTKWVTILWKYDHYHGACGLSVPLVINFGESFWFICIVGNLMSSRHHYREVFWSKLQSRSLRLAVNFENRIIEGIKNSPAYHRMDNSNDVVQRCDNRFTQTLMFEECQECAALPPSIHEATIGTELLIWKSLDDKWKTIPVCMSYIVEVELLIATRLSCI